MTIHTLLRQAREQGASDLILVAGRPPSAYLHGQLIALGDRPLEPAELNELLQSFMPHDPKCRLAESGDADFAYGAPEVGRVRANVHRQRGSLAAAFRFVPAEIPRIESLHLPTRLHEFARLPRGLVLVTGATGSGKSTTLAAMIEYMNDHLARHVITLEDPIEFLFAHRKCVIEQREIGSDSPSFAQALRHVVRQKPDVILVGELRDEETIATALSASETGHLVLGTLHTNTAARTIERIVDMFAGRRQTQVRVQLAGTLQAVICQSLLIRLDGAGMVPAIEMMVMTSAIRRAIRDGETHLIPGMIETGQKFGMCTMDQALAGLVAAGVVAPDDALAKAVDPDKLERLIGGPRPGMETKMGTGARTEHEPPARPAECDEPTLQAAGPARKPWQ